MIKVAVSANEVIGKVSPNIYGQMVEHTCRSMDAQMLDNTGFELDRDKLHTKVAQGWKIITTDPGNIFVPRVDDEEPYCPPGRTPEQGCQKITVKEYSGGVVRLMQNNIAVEQGGRYRGFVFLKALHQAASLPPARIAVKLLTLTQKTIAEQYFTVGTEWEKHEFTLKSDVTDPAAIFAIEISSTGIFFADQAFLYPAGSFGGTRKDLVEQYRALKPPFVRWPGGALFCWKNGIGPLEDRPNSFGTDEFIAFCRSIGAEPMLNVTIREGLQSALDWIEYCNGTVESIWGAERAKNGHPKPYGVKYWVIDNGPPIFADINALFARAMKEKDPSITIMCMGAQDLCDYVDQNPPFCEEVAAKAKDYIDQLCVQVYYDQSFFGPLQGLPYKMGESFARLKQMIDSHAPDRDIKVFLSGWNPQCDAGVDGNMGQALEGAQMFHVLERSSAAGVLDFAATPMQIGGQETSPFYQVNRMYAAYHQPNLLRLKVDHFPRQGSVYFNGYQFPAVDIIALGSDDKRTLVIKIVNNSDTEEFEFEFSLEDFIPGTVRIHEVAAKSILDINTRFNPSNVAETITTHDLAARSAVKSNTAGNRFRYTARLNSVALIELFRA